MQNSYDYVICGAGVSGCVLARRLSDDPAISVLLLEAGGTDGVEAVWNPAMWPENLHSERDWQFMSEANTGLANRKLPLAMGKVLGGGSSINALQWARGHKSDWDDFAEETREPAWNYEAVTKLYDRIERRSPVHEEASADAPFVSLETALSFENEVPLLVEAAQSIGIDTYPNQNGAMTEGDGGAAPMEVITSQGRRQSIYRGYLHSVKARSNLTIATASLVCRLCFEGNRVVAVDVKTAGRMIKVAASREVLLCLGAVNTPKLLLQSGIGPAKELERLGITVKQDLAGVGKNFQDHPLLFGCVWKFHREGVLPNASRAVLQWKSQSSLAAPDLQINQSNGGTLKKEMGDHFGLKPEEWWSLAPALIRPKSRGFLQLTGTEPDSPVRIFSNYLGEAEDLRAISDGIALCRELAASASLAKGIGSELLPGSSSKRKDANFIRQRIGTFWHQSCTAKMGRDSDAVVDGKLRVYGIRGLRVADASVLPRVTGGNTMAPCLAIGENASRFVIEA